MKYRMKADRVIHGTQHAKAGDIVYKANHYDYGLASDDTRLLGVEHISVSKDGEYPLFTVPVTDVEKLE